MLRGLIILALFFSGCNSCIDCIRREEFNNTIKEHEKFIKALIESERAAQERELRKLNPKAY